LVHAHVLIKTALGKALDVATGVAKVKGVKGTCAVTGRTKIFDVLFWALRLGNSGLSNSLPFSLIFSMVASKIAHTIQQPLYFRGEKT